MSIGDVHRRTFEASRRLRGIVVTYSCAAGDLEGLRVLVGSTRSTATTDKGSQIQQLQRDYLILAGELTFDGSQRFPVAGDVIVEADGTRFEVVPMDGEPAARWSDNYRSIIRAHAQQKAT